MLESVKEIEKGLTKEETRKTKHSIHMWFTFLVCSLTHKYVVCVL